MSLYKVTNCASWSLHLSLNLEDYFQLMLLPLIYLRKQEQFMWSIPKTANLPLNPCLHYAFLLLLEMNCKRSHASCQSPGPLWILSLYTHFVHLQLFLLFPVSSTPSLPGHQESKSLHPNLIPSATPFLCFHF